MRDFTDQLERRLVIAARAEARRGPARRLERRVLALPRIWLVAPGVGAAAVAVAAVVLATATTSEPSSPVIHARVVSFRYPTHGPDSGYIIATVTDPFAAQSSLSAAFKAAGLDIVVKLVPVSPSIVGTAVALPLANSELGTSANIETLYGPGCVESPAGCPIGLKIPRDFTGKGTIALGRPAQPGETYAAANSAFAPGESLHCSGLLGAQVSSAISALASDNLTIAWAHTDVSDNTTVDGTPPPGTYYIWTAIPLSAGTVRIDAQPTPPSAALRAEGQTYDQGCTG